MARYSRKSRRNGKICRELWMKSGRLYPAEPTGRCGRTGKMGYADKLTAMIVLGRCASPMKRRNKREEKRMYQCPFCSMWHLSSKDLFLSKNQNKRNSRDTSKVKKKVRTRPVNLSDPGLSTQLPANTRMKPDVGQELVLRQSCVDIHLVASASCQD